MGDEDRVYLGFGNDELTSKPPVSLGDKIRCSVCGAIHAAEGGVDPETGTVSDVILFVRCPERESVLLVGVAGHLVSMTKVEKEAT